MATFAGFVLFPILYLLPSLILAWRGRQGAGVFFIINLLFGWVVLPWFYLMALAVWPTSKR
ncbi:MAG: superinfection immunity protein [Pseudomonadota bacterium]